MANGQFVIRFAAEPGRGYALYHRRDLLSGSWDLAKILTGPAQPGDLENVVEMPAGVAAGFYRVEVRNP